jgi:hypothetical protein
MWRGIERGGHERGCCQETSNGILPLLRFQLSQFASGNRRQLMQQLLVLMLLLLPLVMLLLPVRL